jgi:NDP-sugar pyrophosphorylase family protein
MHSDCDSEISAVILAGGLGTRLRPLTNDCPKVMANINGKPFIHYLLEMLHYHQINDIVLCLGYLGEQVESYVRDGKWLGVSVRYIYDPPSNVQSSYGTAEAIRRALHMLGECFWVINGDTYLDVDYHAIQNYYRVHRLSNLMVVFKNENRWWPSNVALVKGSLRAYNKEVPTPQMHHIDAGVAIFQSEAFRMEVEVNTLSILFEQLTARGDIAAYEVDQRFYEINTLTGLDQVSQYLREHHHYLVVSPNSI